VRAWSLNPYQQRGCCTQCLRAALALARQAHDEELIREIFTTSDADAMVRGMITGANSGLKPDVLEEVIKQERKAEAYPRDYHDGQKFVVEKAAEYSTDWTDEGFDPDDPEMVPFSENEDADIGAVGFGGEPAISAEEEQQAQEFLRKNGNLSMDDVLKDPRSLIEAMAKSLGRKLSQMEIDAIASEVGPQLGGGIPFGAGLPGPGSHKRKKRRR
jgi:hypothetical protein